MMRRRICYYLQTVVNYVIHLYIRAVLRIVENLGMFSLIVNYVIHLYIRAVLRIVANLGMLS